MHNTVLPPGYAGENPHALANASQHYVFKQKTSTLQIWASQEMPYDKDGYSFVA
jgi:hypothetical protein